MRLPVSVLGVDPSLAGAAAALLTVRSRDSIALDIFDIPTRGGTGINKYIDVKALKDRLEEWKPDVAYFEQSWAMPINAYDAGPNMRGQGITSAGRTQRAHGMIESQVRCAVPDDCFHYVLPQVWKRHFRLKGGVQNKHMSRDFIVQLMPQSMRFFLRQKDHNRAESAAVAVYGAIQLGLIRLV